MTEIAVAEKRIISKISISNFNCLNWRLCKNEGFVKMSCIYNICFPRNKPSKSATAGRVGTGRFIILNDSASPKMIIKIPHPDSDEAIIASP